MTYAPATREHDGVVVVAFCSSMDLTGVRAESLRLELEATAHRRTPVVLDLDQVEFLDSAGVGAIVAGARACMRAGVDLLLARPQRDVRTVLDLVRLHRLVGVHDDLDGALRAARGGA